MSVRRLGLTADEVVLELHARKCGLDPGESVASRESVRLL